MTGEGSEEWLARLIRECRTIAVVGLSSNPARPSYRVAAYMPNMPETITSIISAQASVWTFQPS